VSAAEELSVSLETVSENAATAMRTYGRKRLNSALECVKRHRSSFGDHLKSLIVVISTDIAPH
jgi:hypothetical protein